MVLYAANPLNMPKTKKKSQARPSARGRPARRNPKPSINPVKEMAKASTQIKKTTSLVKPAVFVAVGNVGAQKATDAIVPTLLGSQGATVQNIGTLLIPFVLAGATLAAFKKEEARNAALGMALAGVNTAVNMVWPANSSFGRAVVMPEPVAMLPPAPPPPVMPVTATQAAYHSRYA